MKRRGYRYGVAWISLNDDPLETDPEAISGLISVLLLADLFSVEPERVAQDVIRFRRKEEVNRGPR